MVERKRMSIVDKAVNAYFYGMWLRYGVDDGWDIATKVENFSLLASIQELTGVPIKGSTVLDVGCGTGDLYPLLKAAGVGRYVGIDVLPWSVIKARRKYPTGDFRLGDFLKKPTRGKADYVFCSGALTARLPSGNDKYMANMLSKMWEVSRVGIAFNYLTLPKFFANSDSGAVLFSRNQVLGICQDVIDDGFVHAERTIIPGSAQDTIFIWKPAEKLRI